MDLSSYLAYLASFITVGSFVIIDLKHVRSIDVTAAQVFSQVRDAIQERGARLLLCGARDGRASGSNLRNLPAAQHTFIHASVSTLPVAASCWARSWSGSTCAVSRACTPTIMAAGQARAKRFQVSHPDIDGKVVHVP